MDDQMFIEKLNAIETKLDLLLNKKRYMKIPEASKELGIPPYRLRILCDMGVLPSTLFNLTTKNKSYNIDVTAAKKFIESGGLVNVQLSKYLKPC